MQMRLRITLFLALFWALSATGCRAGSTEDTPGDRQSTASEVPARQVADVPAPDSMTARLFAGVMSRAQSENLHDLPLGEVMQEVGKEFMARPYLTGVLDKPAEETLICRLDGFDCVTFLESALALSRTIKAEDYSYETYARHMMDQRYRDGEMDGYCSRLHYFSDWIADNERRGNVRNITQSLG